MIEDRHIVTPTTCQSHTAKNSFTQTIYISQLGANTSVNWNAVRYGTDVILLRQWSLKPSATKTIRSVSTYIIPVLPANCQLLWMVNALDVSATQLTPG